MTKSHTLVQKPTRHTGAIYDYTNKLLLPGFVNTHCHVPMTLLRSIGADLPLDRWLSEKIFPLEDKLNKRLGFLWYIIRYCRNVTQWCHFFSDMYFFGESRANAVLETGINANLSMGILCLDDSPFEKAPMVQENKRLISSLS